MKIVKLVKEDQQLILLIVSDVMIVCLMFIWEIVISIVKKVYI